MSKPTSTPDWTISNPNFGTVTIEPTSGKKITGWTSGERPSYQNMNWLIYNIDQWIKYLDAAVGDFGFDAVVGSGAGASHATLALALADVAITPGKRILVTEDYTVNSVIQITKNNLEIYFKPGVTYSKGSATAAIQVSADGVILRQGRFSGFSGGSDKGITIDAGSDYTMIRDSRFVNCTLDVEDLASTSSIMGTITE